MSTAATPRTLSHEVEWLIAQVAGCADQDGLVYDFSLRDGRPLTSEELECVGVRVLNLLGKKLEAARG
jgi:hypothetical protein